MKSLMRIFLGLFLIVAISIPSFALTGTYTDHKYFYKPGFESYGGDEFDAYEDALDRADLQMPVFPQSYTDGNGDGTSGDPWAGSCIEDSYAAADTGDTIYLRAGYYQLAGMLTIAKTVNIIGEGMGVTFVVTADANGFYVDNPDYVTIKNLTIDGAAQNDGDSKDPLTVADCSYTIIENVELKNGGYYGADIFQTNHSLWQNVYAHDNWRHGLHPGCDTVGTNMHNTYRNIYVWDNGVNGFDDRGTGSVQHTDLYNVYDNIQAWDNLDCGIVIYESMSAIITNSSAWGNTNYGFSLQQCDDLIVSDCVANFNGDQGFYLLYTYNFCFTNVISKSNNTVDGGTTAGLMARDSTGRFANCQFYDGRKVFGIDIAFVDGGAGEDTITHGVGDFVALGFTAGETITVSGSSDNDGDYVIVSVVAGTINVATGELTAEGAGESVTITQYLQRYGIQVEDDTNIELVNCKLSPNVYDKMRDLTTTAIIRGEDNHTLDYDEDYSGRWESALVGENVAYGELLYFDWTDKEWKKTDADASGTMPGRRIALQSKADGQMCLMLIEGYIRDDSAYAFAGALVYASCTAGDITSTAPSGTGDQVQRLGIAKSADIFYFNPDVYMNVIP